MPNPALFRFLITAGPTVEDIDPVRFISNRASGMLGFAMARAASRAGHDVLLIHGPVASTVLRSAPKKANILAVRSAAQMHAAVFKYIGNVDAVIMNAAVADFTVVKSSRTKLKKSGAGLELKLKPTVDILLKLGRLKARRAGLVLIGFALETGAGATPEARDASATKSALEKLRTKNLDAIVLNSPAMIGAAGGHIALLADDGVGLNFVGDKDTIAKIVTKFATSRLHERLKT